MPNQPDASLDRGRVWLNMAILYVVWGSTYLAIAVAVDTIPPFLMAALRFALAGTVLLAWTVVRSRGTLAMPTAPAMA